MKRSQIYFLLIVLFAGSFFISSCQPSRRLHDYDLSLPVDTRTKPIELQTKKLYHAHDVYADNRFEGARLNDFYYDEADNTYHALILPENKPINASPWYAFKLWSEAPQSIDLILEYDKVEHRYPPKFSRDRQHWQLVPADKQHLADSFHLVIQLDLTTEPLWLSAQEIQNSKDVIDWTKAKSLHPDAHYSTIGKSKLGRDIPLLDIYNGKTRKKDIIVILSRQHPPEVTGYMAMQTFVEELLLDNAIANAFRQKYHIIILPLLNPDGVDLGHWRHNAGGVDLNRDWAHYHQPEIKAVVNYIVSQVKKNKSKVILGIDFHSTSKDLYYVFEKGVETNLGNFRDYWLQGLAKSLGNYTPDIRPFPITQPISKNWLNLQFGAEAITFEVGDNTPRPFIKNKGAMAAVTMMELLLYR